MHTGGSGQKGGRAKEGRGEGTKCVGVFVLGGKEGEGEKVVYRSLEGWREVKWFSLSFVSFAFLLLWSFYLCTSSYSLFLLLFLPSFLFTSSLPPSRLSYSSFSFIAFVDCKSSTISVSCCV